MRRIHEDRVLTAAERTKRYRLAHPEKSRNAKSAWALANPDKYTEGNRRRDKTYRDKHPEKALAKNAVFRTTEKGAACYLFWNAKRRAQVDGLEFTLTKDWILAAVEAGRCQVTGLMFDISNGRKPWAPSLDKKDPKGGYTKENTQVVVWMYNTCKWSFTHDDVLTLARALVAGERNAVS